MFWPVTRCCAALIFVILSAASAAAGQKVMQTSGELTQNCSAGDPKSYAAGLCAGFLDGFIDMHEFMEVMTGESLFCPPPEAGRAQFIRAFLDWSAANPARAQEDSGGALLTALRLAYRCQ
jgi:Rap1a immunity proteins